MTEHNQNGFAASTAADEPATAPSPISDNHPASSADAPSTLDFDPVEVAARCDGWSPKKQLEFIEALADCGVVREAAGRVGMTEQSANRLRRRPGAAAFDRAWEAAIRIGVDRLRSVAYERAVTGTVRPRFYKGERIGEEIVHDNRLLIYLLGRKKPSHSDDYRAEEVVKNWDGWMKAIENGTAGPPSSGEDDPLHRIITELMRPEIPDDADADQVIKNIMRSENAADADADSNE